MKILTVRFGALGDLLRMLPLFRSLKASFPGCRTAWAADFHSLGGLLDGHPDVGEFIAFPHAAWGAPPAEFLRFLSALRRDAYDHVIDLQGNLRSASILAFARGKRKIGFDTWREGARLFYPETLSRAGRPWWEELRGMTERIGGTWRFDWQLPLSEDARGFAARFFDENFSASHNGVVFLFPGSRRSRHHRMKRRWATENFVRLALRIRKKTGASFLVGHGPGETPLAQALVEGIGEGALLAPAVALPRFAALVARSTLYVGNDTGPTHLAWLLRVPTVFVSAVPMGQSPPPDAQLPVADAHLSPAAADSEANIARVEEAALSLWR